MYNAYASGTHLPLVLLYNQVMNYRKIPLTRGKEAIVCDCHYDLVAPYKWYSHSTEYARRNKTIEGKQTAIWMHRLIMNTPQDMDTDHINGNRLDNRCSNLRICTTKQNMANQGIRSNNTSGYKGVTFHKTTNKWVACIHIDGKNKNLGYFEDKEDAAEAYQIASLEYHGEFSR